MRWRVSTIHRRADSGRARPPMVDLVCDDRKPVEAYLKSPNLHPRKSPHCLEREWIASRLAHDLGLPAAKLVAVEVTPELIKMAETMFSSKAATTVGDAALAQRLQDGPKLLIGSISLGAGWSEWSQAIRVHQAQLDIACQIYLFDTVVQNWDRAMPNPNLLIKGNEYGMIDNEESFVDAAGNEAERLSTPRPWANDGVVNDVGEYTEHPLWSGIKHHRHAPFDVAVARWKSLSEDTLRNYAHEDVFDVWSRPIANKIIDYIVEAIENIDAVHMQIEANRCN
ncbi:MAG: HipA family kinase [Planktomarina sp.]